MSGRGGRIPWRRFLGEALLIIVSVYVAIVLEGLSSDRERREEANDALLQLRGELVLDRTDAQRVLEYQRGLASDYTTLIDWLGHPATMPTDSAGALLKRISLSNPTAYPRKGAWAALSSTGLLSAIDDPELVIRIADHYENLVARVEYNGNDYDELLNATMMESVPKAWDRVESRSIGDLTEVRSRLDYLATDWNGYYRELLTAYAEALDSLVSDVDRYLESRS